MLRTHESSWPGGTGSCSQTHSYLFPQWPLCPTLTPCPQDPVGPLPSQLGLSKSSDWKAPWPANRTRVLQRRRGPMAVPPLAFLDWNLWFPHASCVSILCRSGLNLPSNFSLLRFLTTQKLTESQSRKWPEAGPHKEKENYRSCLLRVLARLT